MLEESLLATSIGLPERSAPIFHTLAELVDSDTEQMTEDPDSQTSFTSSTFDKLQREAYELFLSSQEYQATPPGTPPGTPPSLNMTLDVPWENTSEHRTQRPDISFSNGSSTSLPLFYRDELARNSMDYAADSTVHRQKRALPDHTDDGDGDMQFQTSCKRPRMPQDTDEDNDDQEQSRAQGSGGLRCPCCGRHFTLRKALDRHRRSISRTLLKCLDLSPGPLSIYHCSEPGCTYSSDRLDATKRHVEEKHHYAYTPSDDTTEKYSIEKLRGMMEAVKTPR
jgi:hypothetical protein